MIVRARTIVTMDGAPIDNGAVAVTGSRITAVGPFNEVRSTERGEVIDLGEQILLPGLINAHCHLDYTMLQGKIPRPTSFADWIRAINRAKETFSDHDYAEAINQGFAQAKGFGTTTIVNLTGFPELLTRVRAPLRTWWFAELIDVRDPSKAESLVERAVEMLRLTETWGLAPHALFTASPGLFRRCGETARTNGALLTTHLAESEEEMLMSVHRKGSLYDFLLSLGVKLFEANRTTPLEQMLKVAAPVDDRWLLVHLNCVSPEDLQLLAGAASKPHIVHCPRSHDYFGHPPFAYETLRKSALNVCLGTDSLASNDDLSLFAEMRHFQRVHPDLPARNVLELVTVNAATALGQSNLIGQLRPGFYADLITIPSDGTDDVFEQILAFTGSIAFLMIAGTSVPV